MKRALTIIVWSLLFSNFAQAENPNDWEVALDIKCSLKNLGLTRFYVDKKVFDGKLGLYKVGESKAVFKESVSSIKDSPNTSLYDFNVMLFDQCITENSKGQEISEEYFEQSKQSHECLKSLTIQSVYMISAGIGIKREDAEKLYLEKIDMIGLPNNSKYASDVYSSSSHSETIYKINAEFFSCKKNIQSIYSDISLSNLVNIGKI
jgi:hypothetical protein